MISHCNQCVAKPWWLIIPKPGGITKQKKDKSIEGIKKSQLPGGERIRPIRPILTLFLRVSPSLGGK